MKPEEKLRKFLSDIQENAQSADDTHLRDADFVRLIEDSAPLLNAQDETNGKPPAAQTLAPLREHLTDCAECLARFRDFYAFYAPANAAESLTTRAEIEKGWREFAPRTAPIAVNEAQKEAKKGFWNKLFPVREKANFYPALGWAFAAVLLFLSVFGFFALYRTQTEKSEIAAELEKQKNIYEERLQNLEQTLRAENAAEQEKNRLAAEKVELENQIARLQTEVERAKQSNAVREKSVAPPPNRDAADNSLIAVNTPIYDLFPTDSAVRGSSQTRNSPTVSSSVRSSVLILNAAGRTDFPSYRAEIVNQSSAVIRRIAGLQKDSLGNFTLTLTPAGLKKGVYRIILFGKNEKETQKIAEYSFSLTAQ